MKQNNKSDSALQRTSQWVATHCLSSMGKGMLFAIGFFGTTILAVAISGTIKTWTTGEVLKSSDLNTTITSLKTAIEGITSSQWSQSSSNNLIYSSGGASIGYGGDPDGKLHIRNRSDATTRNLFRLDDMDSTAASGTNLFIQGNGTSSRELTIANTWSKLHFGASGAGSVTQRLSIDTAGNVGIGTTSPSQTFTVNGNAGNTTGVWVNNSDERLKKNIQPLGNFLEKLTELRPVTFEWKDAKKLNAKEGKHIGFIAQEVEKVFPYWVDTDKDGMKWLSMEGVNAAFVQSFKEVALRLRSGNEKLSLLEESNEKLKIENESLKKKIAILETEVKTIHELSQRDHERSERERLSSLRLEERLRAIENLQMAAQARK